MAGNPNRERIREIFRRVLRLRDSDIGPGCRMGVASGWDSLAQLNLLIALEQEFSLEISPEEGLELVDFESITRLVEVKVRTSRK